MWALGHAHAFRDGALAIINLGGDSDTQGAAYGQIAGALFGANGIPATWRSALARQHDIRAVADRLLAGALGQSVASSPPGRG